MWLIDRTGNSNANSFKESFHSSVHHLDELATLLIILRLKASNAAQFSSRITAYSFTPEMDLTSEAVRDISLERSKGCFI